MPNVRIVSRDTVKPSSLTPNNLRFLQLSQLDQIPDPQARIFLTLFYSDNGTAGKSSQLKKSLSEVLTLFYPLAGRIKYEDDDALAAYGYVECNDEGVEICEARVDCTLSEFLQQLLKESADALLPGAVSADVPLAVQLNVFECGGFAIGLHMSHRLADGTSLFLFVKSWADATTLGGDIRKLVPPTFGFASIFPPRGSWKINRQMKEEQQLGSNCTSQEVKNVALVAKRFVFDAFKIALMREKVYSCGSALLPTRVEAVSALIWRCMMRSQGESCLERKPVAVVAVNIRPRMEPPLPEYSFANLLAPAFAICSPVANEGHKVGYLEGQLRESIAKVNTDFIKQLSQDDEEMRKWNSYVTEPEKCGIDLYMLTSWVRFPVYEIDFGWGKPEMFCPGRYIFGNAAHLSSTRNGEGGIEVLLLLAEGVMEKFEQDDELLAFVSTGPSS